MAYADGSIRIFETTTGRERLKLIGPKRGTSALAYSPDGSRLAAAGSGGGTAGEIHVWDADSGREMVTLRGHTLPIRSARLPS